MVRIVKRIAWIAGCLLLTVAVVWGMEARECADCHTDTSIIEEGGCYLYIDPVQYSRTAHSEVGCPACHKSVTDDHPDDGTRPPLPSRTICGDCHEDVAKEYRASAHAANADCVDCHNPHRVRPVAAVSGFEMNRVCTKCHDPKEVSRTHGVWLPQAELHIEALPCITCHTGSKNYVITFYILKVEKHGGAMTKVKVAALEDLKGIVSGKLETLVDADGNGTISLAELRAFNASYRKKGLELWGMMTPEHVSHSLETLDNRWDCTFCHASGPSAMQTSFLAFPEGQGSYRRVPIERGAVLDAIYGTPDFYMIGVTRNRTLTIIGLIIAAAGLTVPIGHGSLRLLTMKNRKRRK